MVSAVPGSVAGLGVGPNCDAIADADTSSGTGAVTIRDLHGTEDLRAVAELYGQAFGRSDAVNPRLLTAIGLNGGLLLGAVDAGELVGFVYGFVGRAPEDPADAAGSTALYHYSQTAAVQPDQRGRGVGRLLKLAQRDRVLAQGLTRMRWAFDPHRTGNAHFNLDVLGATARWFTADMYGHETVAGQPNRPSDRLILDWDLQASRDGLIPAHSPRADDSLEWGQTDSLEWGHTRPDGPDLLLAVPRTGADPLATATPGPLAIDISTMLRESIAAGYQVISCRAVSDRTAIYRCRKPPPITTPLLPESL